jgi:two-component system, OmpR family, response regulator
MKKKRIKLFLVDDDPVYLRLLEAEFVNLDNFDVETFATGELCLEKMAENPDVIILDYNLNGLVKTAMNGIETLDKIKELNPALPVVMLSSQDHIDVAVNCMHHNAFDYVIKSETAFLRLRKIIDIISSLNTLEKELIWYMNRM